MSDRNQIEEIKRKLDIVSVVREYVPSLKKMGRNYFGLCPFHSERSPSFSVNEELQIYKCFGCGESGDVIGFIEKVEGIDFPRALEITAKRAGVELVRTFDPAQQKRRAEREKILEANKLATQYYHFMLMEHKSGEAAREYVKTRKLRKQELEKFQIGFAPDGFENLKKFMLKKGFAAADLVKWGLLADKNGHTYDKFRRRLMFPIFDHLGDIVGFSGRVIVKDDIPKYLNSPETPVYHKSELVYGLNQAKEAVRKQNFAIVVEGNVDLLSSHKVGVENIVAPLGTALTEEQLKLLRRYAEEVYFSFDTDAAGEKALIRSLELAEKVGLKFKAIDLGDYQDADELIREGGDWQKTVAKAQPLILHLMNRLAKDYDLNNATDKDKYAKQILGYINRLTSNIEKAHYLDRLSEAIKVEQDVLKKELSGLDAHTDLKAEDVAVITHYNLSGAKYLLAFLLAHEKFAAKLKAELFADVIADPTYQKVISIALDKTSDPAKLLTESELELYTELKLAHVGTIADEREFTNEVGKLINRMHKDKIKLEIRQYKFSKEEDRDQNLGKLTKRLGSLD